MREQGCFLALIVMMLAAAGLAWLLAAQLPAWALQVGLVAALMGWPLGVWLGWRMGRLDARAFLMGVERGTGAVINAGDRVADLRAAKVEALRRGREPVEMPLPQPTRLEILHMNGDEREVEL